MAREAHARRIERRAERGGRGRGDDVPDVRFDIRRLGEDSRIVAHEFVGTSISSGYDGTATPKNLDKTYAENPFVRFHNAERGYVLCDVGPKEWRTDYRTVPFVVKPGAPVNTRASYIIESGTVGLKRA